jgi:hypothetical protein
MRCWAAEIEIRSIEAIGLCDATRDCRSYVSFPRDGSGNHSCDQAHRSAAHAADEWAIKDTKGGTCDKTRNPAKEAAKEGANDYFTCCPKVERGDPV